MRRCWAGLVILIAAGVLGSTAAHAESIVYGFEQLSDNSGSDFSSDFSLTVTFDDDAGTLAFALSNVAGGSGAITEVYWHDTDKLLSLSGYDLPDDWSNPASPEDMENASGFTTAFSADADPPPVHSGIEGGESASFVFFVTSGTDWDDILGALGSRDLMLGFHASSLGAGEDSEWFLNDATPVPEPGTLLLLGSSLAAAGAISRRRRRL